MHDPIPSALLTHLVNRLRDEEPDLQALLVSGSHARDEHDAYSDLDLVALTLGHPRQEARTWFVPTPAGPILHVSVAAERLAPLDAQAPASWSLGFPAVDVQRWLWGTAHAREVVGADPSERTPAAPGELGDFVELYVKVRRATAARHSLSLRWAARMLAEYAPGLLREFNPEQIVHTPVEALAAAFHLPHAPAHYREDFEICAGVNPATDAAIAAAAGRLVGEMLAYLQERYTGDYASGDIRRELVTGTLHLYLAQYHD